MKSTFKIIFGLVGLNVAMPAAAEPLGRLFFTAEQRAQLEQDKNAGPGDSRRVLTVNGIVQKHGGARTVWINGVAQPDNDDRAPESQPIAAPGQAQPVRIKVGQKMLIRPVDPAPPSPSPPR